MVGFLELQLPSDDSDDSTYETDESSLILSDNEESVTTSDSKKLRVKKAKALLESMTESFLKQRKHTLTAMNDQQNPLQQFQKPSPIPKPPSKTIEDIYDYLDRSIGLKKPKQHLDILRLKEEIRKDINVSINLNILEDDLCVPMTQKVRYAGQVYEFNELVEKNSKRHKKHANKQKLGGTLAELDSTVSTLKSLQNVTSIEKSRLDWYFSMNLLVCRANFTRKKNLSFLREHSFGYLAQKSFLYNIDIKKNAMRLEAKRKNLIS